MEVQNGNGQGVSESRSDYPCPLIIYPLSYRFSDSPRNSSLPRSSIRASC